VGFIGFEVTGQAGQVIEVVWNDRLSADGAVRPCAQTGRNALQFTLRDGRQSFLAFMPQFARFLRISQRGPGAVTVHRLAFTEFRFAAEAKGDFVCSDAELNRVYQAARWTAALNTLDGILTEEVLGIRLGFPLKLTPHSGGVLQSCRGFITTPQGRVQVAWESQQDRYQWQASLPQDVTAEVILPPESKAVWQAAPPTVPWRETLTVHGATTIVVSPGQVEAQ
jgi:hypothetical protein